MNKFAADIARYRAKGYSGKELWLNPAVWAIGCYRLGNWLHVARPFILIRVPLKVVSFFANKFCEVFMEMCIDPSRFHRRGALHRTHWRSAYQPSGGSGKNCDIAHRVTIGASAMGRQGAPVFGDDVYIGTGATLVGKIRVGNGAKIAANTLVISNIPEGATVMGVPGRIIMRPPKAVEPPVLAAAESNRCKVIQSVRTYGAPSRMPCPRQDAVAAVRHGRESSCGLEQAGGCHVLCFFLCGHQLTRLRISSSQEAEGLRGSLCDS